MKKNHLVSKVGKTALCALLAVAMVVPANLAQIPTGTAEVTEAEAADDLPDPIMTLDFEQGFEGEAKENGFEVKKYDGILQFKEVTDDKGNYTLDENGDYIYELDYESPFIENGDYKYGTDGNQPTTYYDAAFGNTLMLDGTKINEAYVKRNSDELDEKYPVGTELQEKITTYSAATIRNPYAGMDFSEEPTFETNPDGTISPVWTKGVSISYWVKCGVNDLTEEQEEKNIIKNDSILFTFQNDSEDEVYVQDDLMKYEACLAYNAFFKEGKTEYKGEYSNYEYKKEYFDLGTETDYTVDGTTYKVLSGYGKLIRLNKDYKGSSTDKYYFADDKKESPDKEITVDGKKLRLFEIGTQLYDEYSHFEMDASKSETGKGSRIKRGRISGSMTIAASNSFAFAEDDYQTKTVETENGPVGQTIQGGIQENPNDQNTYNKITQFRYYNMVYWQGEGDVCYGEVRTEGDKKIEETEWHYVTCVIENDWVTFYVDGEKYDAEICDKDWYYSAGGNKTFDPLCAKKYFNKGYGYRYPYNTNNVDDWSADGTVTNSPANTLSRTMLEWLSDEDTVLMIGGQGSANAEYYIEGNDIGTGDGTLLDDIEFYDVPLDEDQAAALYEEAVAEKGAEKTPTLLKKFTFDDDAVNAMPAGMEASPANGDGMDPYVVNDVTRGHALLVQAGKTTATSATVFENPFKGMTDLEGVTVSYWYKAQKNKKGAISNSICVSFNDEPKILTHSKIQDSQKETKTRTGLYTQASMDATFEAGYDSLVYQSLKNKYTTTTRWGAFTDKSLSNFKQEAADAQTEWTDRTNSFSEWHFVTMVANNAGITMYYDGQKLPNNIVDTTGKPSYYGPRFYDGYYVRINDGFASYKLASNNQGATPLLTFLTQDDTKAYVGQAYVYGSATTYQGTAMGEYDDIAYYAGAMTDEQVAAAYEEALAQTGTPVAGEATTDINNSAAGNTPTGDEKDVNKGNTDESGNLVFESTKTGVKVTAPAGSIDANAELVVTVLGESDSAARYTNADSVLAGINGLSVGKRVLYDIHFELDGQVVQPSAPVTVELTPYSGYTAAQCSVVYIDGAAVMTTSVSGGKLVFQTQNLGEYALVEAKAGEAPAGNSGNNGNNVTGSANNTSGTKSTASGSAAAGKTGDMANVLLPLLLLAAAAAALVYVRRKRVTE